VTSFGVPAICHIPLTKDKECYIIAIIRSCENLQMSCGEKLKAEIQKAGYRVTPQRAVILETIAHMEGHRSAQEVFESASDRLPGLNIATVYRTLDTLHQAGIIDLFSTSPDSMRFSLHDASNKHAHLHCKKCNRVFELSLEPFDQLIMEIKRDLDFAIDSNHLSFQGFCKACRQKEPSKDKE
jgi:Fur family ferric uptake transcriptional regulator